MQKYEGYWYPDDIPPDFVTSESTDKDEVPLYKSGSGFPDFEEYHHLFAGTAYYEGLPA